MRAVASHGVGPERGVARSGNLGAGLKRAHVGFFSSCNLLPRYQIGCAGVPSSAQGVRDISASASPAISDGL